MSEPSSGSGSGSGSHDENAAASQYIPDDGSLDAFKADVRTWIETDNSIRLLQESLKERRDAKRLLTERILAFMTRYNIEDLSTRDGRLRFQVSYVRAPLSQQTIRTRITDFYATDAIAAQELSSAVFGHRDRCQRMWLRRMASGGGG